MSAAADRDKVHPVSEGVINSSHDVDVGVPKDKALSIQKVNREDFQIKEVDVQLHQISEAPQPLCSINDENEEKLKE